MAGIVRLVRAHIVPSHRPFRSSIRQFSSSSAALARRAKPEDRLTASDALDLLEDDYDDDDTTSAGHMMLREQRKVLYYLRLIEHEMPQLVVYRKKFIPPTSETPLIVRRVDYAGEKHPATTRRAVVASVDDLPLEGEAAVHQFKLLAGPRWTPSPPSDAGVRRLQNSSNGYVKISCEDFAKPSLNIKWASDVLDKLIVEANTERDSFSHVPLDLRHVYSRARKNKRGDHRGQFRRPSLQDFPQEWLQQHSSDYQ